MQHNPDSSMQTCSYIVAYAVPALQPLFYGQLLELTCTSSCMTRKSVLIIKDVSLVGVGILCVAE